MSDTKFLTYGIDDLLQLMVRLRDPEDGCPWDVQQSYKSIVPSTLEEAYEVADAIEKEDYGQLKEELGDLLFQVIFYSQLGQEEGRFSFAEIVSTLVEKLVRRHPHVFPEGHLHSRSRRQQTDGDEELKLRWEVLKQQEREAKGLASVLADVPLNLPALSRAAKLQKRAARVGFDWPELSQVLAKVEEELLEVREALALDQSEQVAEELGDLLFSVVNVCRQQKLDPEAILRSANRKFERRFQFVETSVRQSGQSFEQTGLAAMEAFWQQAKRLEKSGAD